ncbi:RNA 2'-phosphotransferase [Brevibacillus gelatini]|uniref:RNA 2'-phosphotransferase n=2 Tax=Brevibacillus gelatini TaxID=1655277 RepID=A0A3M8AP20_9BACL|nr:RNA 2'-phosphotransferase [Brevibacillus gelatini]
MWRMIKSGLIKIKQGNKQWESVDEQVIVNMIENSAKKRHEILNGKIRALYGHSTPQKILKTVATPPSILFHGTSRHLFERIRNEGLKPMARQYVHMSVDIHTANMVGKRKDSKPILLKIQAGNAARDGVKFYQGNNLVWLADYVPSQYISVEQTRFA